MLRTIGLMSGTSLDGVDAAWLETDAATELGDQAVQRKLELVGKSTSHILMTTEQQAAELRKSAEEECAQMIAEAEAAAQQTRNAADEYAKQTRAKADADATAKGEAAAAQAREEPVDLVLVVAASREREAGDANPIDVLPVHFPLLSGGRAGSGRCAGRTD